MSADVGTRATAHASSAALSIGYQGWSGCVLRANGASTLVFDPAPDSEVPEGATLILTHGHFEHVDGALAYLRSPNRPPVSVIASPALCRYLARRTAGPEDRFIRVEAGDRIEVGGWTIHVFEWIHMSLMPPGLGNAARYVMKLVGHPRGLARMALGGARGPKQHGPMLGFRVQRDGGRGSLVYYGEGLHRRTSREELAQALGDEPVDALVFGAEPEDLEALPSLLAEHAVGRALAFEPHRGWRADFDLPQIDLEKLVARLRREGIDAGALTPGATIALGSH